MAEIAEPAVYEAARAYLLRPSKRLLGMFAKARRNILDSPHLSLEMQNSLAVIWWYMSDLYDPDSEISRLYLQARPSIQMPDSRI